MLQANCNNYRISWGLNIMRTGFESTLRWTLLGIELATLEVKGDYTVEAPTYIFKNNFCAKYMSSHL